MKNTSLLFAYNNQKTSNVYMKQRRCVIRCHSEYLDGDSLMRVVKYMNGIKEKYGKLKPLVIIDFGKVKVVDKLVYIMLETICFSIIHDLGFEVKLKIQVIKHIISNGFDDKTPLYILTKNKPVHENCRDFIEYCEQTYIFKENHYRRIVSADESDESEIFCKIMSEVRAFLKNYYGDLERIKQIAEIVAELCGNAWEHSKSDCCSISR